MPPLPDPRRPPSKPPLTVLPHLSAPIDEGRLIPYPPRSRWEKLLRIVLLVALGVGLLAFAFVRATSFR